MRQVEPSGEQRSAAAGTRLVELASGVDALYMSGRGDISPNFLADLRAARSLAEESGEPEEFELGECSVRVKPRSMHRYKYWLEHEHGQIGVTESESLPALRIQPRAEYLHAVGPSAALAYFAALAGEFTRGLRLTASRLDLFADFQGWALGAEDRYCFVSRADDRVTHEKSEAFTGFQFGQRKGKTVMARIYDKTLDAKRKGADWWPERWGELFDATSPVWRIEYEFGRVGLQQFRVDTPSDALTLAPSLWAYATGKWLSHRTRTDDETRSRWPISVQWAQIQRATLAEGALGLDRIQQGSATGSLRKMMPGIVGYMSSAAALLGANTWAETSELLAGSVYDYGSASHQSFEERVAKKRRARDVA